MLTKTSPPSSSLCVRMLDWFDFHGHMCISFELLALSTFDFLKQNNFLPYPMAHIRHMAYQICKAINCERLFQVPLKPHFTNMARGGRCLVPLPHVALSLSLFVCLSQYLSPPPLLILIIFLLLFCSSP